MTRFAGAIAGRRYVGVSANVLALGALLGALPGLAVAGERAPGAQNWSGTPSSAATTTATSILALGVPAQTFTVTTLADVVDPGDGKLSLREAVAQANATTALDAIVFASALEGQTLMLTGGELLVSEDLTVDGDRNDDGRRVTIDGNGARNPILHIDGGTNVVLSDLVLTRGLGGVLVGRYAAPGSLVLDRSTISDSGDNGITVLEGGRLTAIGSSIVGNSGAYGGGGILAISATVTIRGSLISGNEDYGSCSGIYAHGGALVIEDSIVSNNKVTGNSTYGGGICVNYGTITIARSTISGNDLTTSYGGGLSLRGSNATVADSTIANNFAQRGGGGVRVDRGVLTVRNSTITGNHHVEHYCCGGGGIALYRRTRLDITNSIVAGNRSELPDGSPGTNPDIAGPITSSNGHNVFGSNVRGSIAGDRQNVRPGAVFAALDPATGGGKLSPEGNVPLKDSLANPALSGADPLAAGANAQLGAVRPLPAGSLPDIGAAEIDQRLSTSPTVGNDVLTGSNAANNLVGLAGNDLIRGLGGNDTINAGDGSDVLDGGPGNDVLNGGTGVDLVTYAGTTAVIVDLTAVPATARRGSEVDTLNSIEGAIGSSKADTFKGDGGPNWFQGGLGKDIYSGGAFPDTYDFDAIADSPAGTGRDLIKDFAPGQDIIDLAGIDADTTTPGNQSFRWVGKASLTGAAQLGYFVTGGNTIVRASTDADAAAELEIQLTGVKTLTEDDFVP